MATEQSHEHQVSNDDYSQLLTIIDSIHILGENPSLLLLTIIQIPVITHENLSIAK